MKTLVLVPKVLAARRLMSGSPMPTPLLSLPTAARLARTPTTSARMKLVLAAAEPTLRTATPDTAMPTAVITTLTAWATRTFTVPVSQSTPLSHSR